jgi:serine/threonine protein kinase
MVDESTQLPQPQQVANYRLGRVIGQGGWGVVYEAVNTRNDERVALKLLHAHLAGDEAYLERFQREAQVATLLRSPYTVHLLDFGVDAGQHFLVMNLIEGEVLSEIVKQGPLPPARAFKIASQVALALEEAEARGVVHRDIKPDNVMVTPEGLVKVLDFGIARQAGRATLTHTGAFIGTLSYAAPEAAEGQVDHRSDLYSLGVTLFHMLTGQPPFAGEMIQLLRQHREAPVPRRLLDGLPEDAIEVVLRLLEKLPDDRYQTASETAGVLERLSIAAAAREDAPLEMEATEVLSGTADTSLITMALESSGISRRFVPRASMTTYQLTFQNDGSQAMTLRLDATDPSASCEIIVPEAVVVPPRRRSPSPSPWRQEPSLARPGGAAAVPHHGLRRRRRTADRRHRRVRGSPAGDQAGRRGGLWHRPARRARGVHGPWWRCDVERPIFRSTQLRGRCREQPRQSGHAQGGHALGRCDRGARRGR